MIVYMVVATGSDGSVPFSIHMTLDGANQTVGMLEQSEPQYTYCVEAWEVDK